MLHNFLFVHGVSHANTAEPSKSEKWLTPLHLVDNFQGLAIIDLCRKGTWTNTCLARDTAKGVACKTRSEPQ